MIESVVGPTLLLDVFVKASLLMVVVCIGSWLIRRRSSAAQHRWWALGFIGCLLVPLLGLLTPTWTLPIFSEPVEIARLPATDRIRAANGSEFEHLKFDKPVARVPISPMSQPQRTQPSIEPGSGALPVSGEATAVAEMKPIGSANPRSVLASLLIVWFAGAVACWVCIAWRHLLLRRVQRHCDSPNDPSWNDLLNQCRQSLKLKQDVTLLRHQSLHSPVSAGLWQPVVILPADADTWDLQRRRLVLLHELAHVQRRDVLTQTIANVTCGLYWFHPLYWYGLRQMRHLRELACDDLVLSCGQHATGYADVLLDIARTYRHQSYSTAVGMAHCSNIENRILTILDTTRQRKSLSRAGARWLFALAVVLVAFVGTAQLRSQTEPRSQNDSAADSLKQTNDQSAKNKATKESESQVPPTDSLSQDSNSKLLREMKIRILDDAGNPLSGAILHIGVWYADGYKGPKTPKDHTADVDGNIVLKLPKRLKILRLWPKQPGYVGEFKNFGLGTHRLGELIPDEYEFRLAKGHEIGGRVVDTDGKPVAGAQVRVEVDDAGDEVSTYLTDSFGQPEVFTNSEGRWALDCAPPVPDDGNDCSFQVKLSHEDYISDVDWRDAKTASRIVSTELRSQESTLVLERGFSVQGKVADSEGKPVTKGWVVWTDEPYLSQNVLEKVIEADGSFRTPPLTAGKYPITIVAPGFAAQRRMVEVNADVEPLEFQLEPGKRIELRLVDAAGNPVPRAYVGIGNELELDTWQGSNALHNYKHSNVPDYGIPRKANDDGVFVWDWAPKEPVKYRIYRKGFRGRGKVLIAQSDPHVITLTSARVVAGSVTDAVTGEPIKKFQAMPVIVFGETHFSTWSRGEKLGVDGRYELPLTGSARPDVPYRVRFEATGYRSIVSEQSFGPKDGRVEMNVQLEPAPARQGRVVDGDGQPVANAQVIEGTPTWVPTIDNGNPEEGNGQIPKTDSEGRFELRATAEPVRVRVLHDSGIAEKQVDPDATSIGEMKLQPWASVSGQLIQDGQPVPDQWIGFLPTGDRGLGEARFQDSYGARTDADGRFELKRLPPWAGSLKASLGPWRDSPLTSAESLAIQLEPGEHREVVLGGDGAIITGQVIATGRGDVPLDRNWSLNYLISRDRGITQPLPDGFPKLSFDPAETMKLAWTRGPNFSDWVTTRDHHFVKLSPDGDLRVTGVEAGEYDLLIQLYEQPAGCLVETVGEKIVPVRVQGSGVVDVGRIEVACRVGPRVGSDMRAYEFVDANGQRKFIDDLAGRHVLLHVWASWCTPCLRSMPELAETVDTLSDRPITFVGLNVDSDSVAAKKAAERYGMKWSQNYLGEDSELARQLAISSVPTYYLVGPSGKLVASGTDWSEIQAKVMASIDGAQD